MNLLGKSGFILASGGLLLALTGCAQPLANVAIPAPSDRAAYQPQPYQKPVPGESSAPAYPAASGPSPVQAAFVAAWQAQREPRLMVVVQPPQHGQTYTNIHATPDDFDAIGIDTIGYLAVNGQVDIQSSAMAKKVLNRESFLRLQNGDSAVLPLLKHQLNTDVIVEIKAEPTAQASLGPAVRLLAEAVGTTDARILATASMDMPLPMTHSMIKQCTAYISSRVMQQLTGVWLNGFNPITVRIFHAAGVDDVLKIKHFIQKVPGVSLVVDRGMTGSSTTAYGELAVRYSGAPDDFYSALKQELGVSTGLKATDIQNNTVDMEITGPMILHTTTIKTITKIRTRTNTTIKTVNDNPIMPAPN